MPHLWGCCGFENEIKCYLGSLELTELCRRNTQKPGGNAKIKFISIPRSMEEVEAMLGRDAQVGTFSPLGSVLAGKAPL